MLFSVDYSHSAIPPLNSDLAKKIARKLYDEFNYWREARQELETEIWKACDDAYLCYRTLPTNDGMQWADASDLGETDLWDGVNFLSSSIALSLMPRDESYLAPVPYAPEDQDLQNRVRDFMTGLCRRADLRGQYAKHLKQVLIRGTGAISLDWKRVTRLRRLNVGEQIAMQSEAADGGIYLEPKELKRQRIQENIYNGPVIRPLDMYDVYMDPMADLSVDHDIPMAIMTYKTVEELKRSTDENGEPIYGNLDDITEWTINDLASAFPNRYRSLQVLGLNPFASERGHSKFVPVLVFHRLYFSVDDNSWVDTFFHLALTHDREGYRLIAIRENPSDYGHRCVFFDSYQDIIGSAYGVGAVEKSLSAWNRKNVMAALGLNAALLSVFPPMAVVTDLLLDDRRIDVSPGGYNPIKFKPAVGTNFAAPLPLTPNGMEASMRAQQYYGQQIMGQMGAYGYIQNDPTRSLTQAKTATQINTETTSSATARDDLLEQITIRTLEPLVQAIYDSALQYMTDELIQFEQTVGGQTGFAQLSREELDRKRKIIVTGWHGLQNKQQEIAELKDALAVMVQGNAVQFIPNAPALMQELLFKLLARLGVQNLDQYRVPQMQPGMGMPGMMPPNATPTEGVPPGTPPTAGPAAPIETAPAP